MGRIKVSHTKIQTWRRCRRAYHYQYNERIRKKSKGRPLTFGIIVHEMIEAYAYGKSPWKVLTHYSAVQGKLFREEIEEYGNIIEDIEWIMTEYFNKYQDDSLQYVTVKKKKAEIDFEVEIADDVIFNGIIDGVVTNADDGTTWIMEHKSVSTMPDERTEWKNNQAFIYDTVLERMNAPVIDGIVFDYILSKPPTYPSFTQTGKIARIDSIATLPQTFKDFLYVNNLDETEYREVLQRLNKKTNDYFQRKYVPIKKHIRDIVITDMVTTAREIAERGKIDSTMNIDKHCTWCNYRLICTARMSGGDEDFVRERYYAKEEKSDKKKTIKRAARSKS